MLSVAAIAKVLAYYIPGAVRFVGWSLRRAPASRRLPAESPHRAAQPRQRLLLGGRSGSRTSIV